MGIMSELFKSPFHGPEQPGFNDGLVEPSADFDPNIFASFVPEAIDEMSGMTYGSDAFDSHDPNADPFGIGRDMEPEAYIGEAQRLVEEFSGNDDLSLEDLVRRRFYELRAELRTRPWFRILCDTKLMIDESRAAWAGRRHRALLAIGLRKAPTQPCQHCFHENGADENRRHNSVGYPHHNLHPGFASPSMGDFAAPDRSSDVASAIQSMGFQIANSSYGVNRAVRAMEQAVSLMARGQHHQQTPQPFHGHPVPVAHPATSGVVQHVPSVPFPVYQRPADLAPETVEAPASEDGMADFTPNELPADAGADDTVAGHGGAVVLMGGQSSTEPPSVVIAGGQPADSDKVVLVGDQPDAQIPAEVAVKTPDAVPPVSPLVASDASLAVADVDVLRGEIAETIKKLSAALDALKRPS